MATVLLQSLYKLIPRTLFSKYAPKSNDITIWNNLLDIEVGKWSVSFFFNHPTFVSVDNLTYAVYSSSAFGFSVVEKQNKYVKGFQRHVYTMPFKEVLKMCYLDSSSEEFVEVSKPIKLPNNSLDSIIQRHVRVQSLKDNRLTFSMFDSADLKDFHNIREFTLNQQEVAFLCEILKCSVTELTGLDTQFLMLHADTINEAAHGCLSEHKDIMELDNVDWEKLFKQNNSFALEVAQP